LTMLDGRSGGSAGLQEPGQAEYNSGGGDFGNGRNGNGGGSSESFDKALDDEIPF